MKDYVHGWHQLINHMSRSYSQKKYCLVVMHFEYVLAWVALIILYFVTQNPDDDDDQDGGMMVPSYQGN
jgi:hypothetical protein